MSSTLTRAIRYDLVDELDELYEGVCEAVALIEDLEAYDPDSEHLTPQAFTDMIRLFNAVEGRVAVLDSAGGHEHGDPGELDNKGGFRNG